MNLRASWQFYKTIVPFIAAFSLVGVVALGLLWGFVLFATVGLWFGFVGFKNFRKEEYYFYHNLGFTKWCLVKNAFLINLIAGIPFFMLLTVLFLFLFGDLSIT